MFKLILFICLIPIVQHAQQNRLSNQSLYESTNVKILKIDQRSIYTSGIVNRYSCNACIDHNVAKNMPLIEYTNSSEKRFMIGELGQMIIGGAILGGLTGAGIGASNDEMGVGKGIGNGVAIGAGLGLLIYLFDE